MSKYDPLQTYLAQCEGSQRTLSFAEIERIIGAALPRSAREYREWWANQSDTRNRPQAKAWQSAGWEVRSVQLGQRIEFVRRR